MLLGKQYRTLSERNNINSSRKYSRRMTSIQRPRGAIERFTKKIFIQCNVQKAILTIDDNERPGTLREVFLLQIL